MDERGQLELEIPLRDGLRHGTEYTWFFGEWLSSAEPYHEGKLHGVAQQWSAAGKLIGTYEMVHGTGIDLWRNPIGGRDEGPYFVSEVHYVQDGNHHGFTCWINENQKSVSVERHYLHGLEHGIEREWNRAGRLSRGYPKYFIHGKCVDKRKYLRAVETDATLPPFRLKDNKPGRTFPPEIQRHLPKNLPK